MIKRSSLVFDWLIIVLILMIGLWLIVIKPLGPNLSLLPGELVDNRLDIYLLEHFFRWISGLDKSFWTASFAYPYQNTVAFSDNFLGSAPFYIIFRWFGFNRESAFQGWYILGYCLNFLSAAYVLSRLNFKPLAIGAGAFFFTFGLPLLGQENHVALLYRFGVPLACFALWRMQEAPKLRTFAAIILWTVWQFYLSIYLGVFLVMFLIVFALLLPLCMPSQPFWRFFRFWPHRIKSAWLLTPKTEQLIVILATIFLGLCMGIQLWPYYQVTRIYGFSRNWSEVAKMLPTWQSYLLADGSQLWRFISTRITGVPMRWEHQLFPGGLAVALVMIGLFLRGNSKTTMLVKPHFWATLVLAAFTFSINGYSLFRYLWILPGINSLRAITRIILVLMWPIALLISTGFEKLLQERNHYNLLGVGVAYILVGLLMAEAVLFDHFTFNKAASQARLTELNDQIPVTIPDQPILIVANKNGDPWNLTEVDGMLLSQQLGWPTLNGYTGYLPPGYGPTTNCSSLPKRILAFMNFAKITSTSYYFDMMKRAVPIGFTDCDPGWWTEMPHISSFAGPLPKGIFAGLALKVLMIKSINNLVSAQVEITNDSSMTLPALSSTGNFVGLSWRFVDFQNRNPLSGFDTREYLDFDVLPGQRFIKSIYITPPAHPGCYLLEVTAVQELVVWFYDRGVPIARSEQELVVNAQNQILITNGLIP